MGRIIKLGKSNSKICATCEYWDGGTGSLPQKDIEIRPKLWKLTMKQLKH